MKNSDWASVIAALGLGSVGFWFWRKSRQIEAQTAKTKQEHAPSPQASTAQPKVVAKVSQSAIEAIVKELNKPKVVSKAAKLDSSVLKRMVDAAEERRGLLGMVVQWGTIAANAQELMREGALAENWHEGFLWKSMEQWAAADIDKNGLFAAYPNKNEAVFSPYATGWDLPFFGSSEGWPLQGGAAGRCAFPPVGGDLGFIGSTPLLREGNHIPFADGWTALPGPFRADSPIYSGMTNKYTFKAGTPSSDLVYFDKVTTRLSDTEWGKSFLYNKYKRNEKHIGLAMPKPPSDCKTTAQLDKWVDDNGGWTARRLLEGIKKDPLLMLKIKPDSGLSTAWYNWYDSFGRAMRVSRNLIQAAESWRVTAHQQKAVRSDRPLVEWDHKNYYKTHIPAIEPPSWWKAHCLAWGCGVASSKRARTHWTPAWGFSWWDSSAGKWNYAKPLYPPTKVDVEKMLRYIVEVTPVPGSKWHDHALKRGRTVDTSNWVGWNWPLTSGSLYPNYRQSKASQEAAIAAHSRFAKWAKGDGEWKDYWKPALLSGVKLLGAGLSAMTGNAQVAIFTMANLTISTLAECGVPGVMLSALSLAKNVAGFAAGQSWSDDPAGSLRSAYDELEQGAKQRAEVFLKTARNQIDGWKNIENWDYGQELIGRFTDTAKKYRTT